MGTHANLTFSPIPGSPAGNFGATLGRISLFLSRLDKTLGFLGVLTPKTLCIDALEASKTLFWSYNEASMSIKNVIIDNKI